MPIDPQIPLSVGQGVPAVLNPMTAMRDVMALQQERQQMEIARENMETNRAYREAMNEQRRQQTETLRQTAERRAATEQVFREHQSPLKRIEVLESLGLVPEASAYRTDVQEGKSQLVKQVGEELALEEKTRKHVLDLLPRTKSDADWTHLRSHIETLNPEALANVPATWGSDAQAWITRSLAEYPTVEERHALRLKQLDLIKKGFENEKDIADFVAASSNADEAKRAVEFLSVNGYLTPDQAAYWGSEEGWKRAQRLAAKLGTIERFLVDKYGANATPAQQASGRAEWERLNDQIKALGGEGAWFPAGSPRQLDDGSWALAAIDRKTGVVREIPFEAGSRPKPTEGGLTKQNNALSGLATLRSMDEILSGPDANNVILKASVPGSPFARRYKALGMELGDLLARLRTGAQINEQEMKIYMEDFLPSASDIILDNPEETKKIIAFKLGKFRGLFWNLARAGGLNEAQVTSEVDKLYKQTITSPGGAVTGSPVKKPDSAGLRRFLK